MGNVSAESKDSIRAGQKRGGKNGQGEITAERMDGAMSRRPERLLLPMEDGASAQYYNT